MQRGPVYAWLVLLAMSARNRRLPRHRAWPLTTTDINECLGPYTAHVTDLQFSARLSTIDSQSAPGTWPSGRATLGSHYSLVNSSVTVGGSAW